MSVRFQEVFCSNDNKLRFVLKDVLDAITPGTYTKVKEMLDKTPKITDDEVFAALAKDEKKVAADSSFNNYKLVGVAGCMEKERVLKIRPNMKILDYGGANGAAAKHFASTIGAKEIYVADVNVPDVEKPVAEGAQPVAQSPAIQKKNNEPEVIFTRIEPGKALPFKDGEFDVVFCMMTLHHIKDAEEVVKELHRICRSWLVIQEHDAIAGYPAILDIVHGMYIFVKNEDDYEKIEKMSDFQAWYKPMQEWDVMLSKAGFKHRWMKRTRSAQNNYFALYEAVHREKFQALNNPGPAVYKPPMYKARMGASSAASIVPLRPNGS